MLFNSFVFIFGFLPATLAIFFLTARLAGGARSRQVVYAIGLPSVGLVIVLMEVAAHHV